MFGLLLNGIIVGAIAGLIWAFALNIKLSSAITVGAVAGLIAGLVLSRFGALARARGNLASGETNFISSALVTTLGMGVAAIGLLVWLARAVLTKNWNGLLWIAAIVVGFVILSWLARKPERDLIRQLQHKRAEREASGAPRCESCGNAIVDEQDDHGWSCPKNPCNAQDSPD